MLVKRILRVGRIFTGGIAIMTALWLNWKLPARRLPNDARIFRLTGSIQRRQGHWEESTRNLERAAELDPRDIDTLMMGLQRITGIVGAMRKQNRGWPVHWLSNLTMPLQKYGLRTSIMLGKPIPDRCIKQSIQFGPQILPRCRVSLSGGFYCALAERDGTAAKNALIASGENAILVYRQRSF